MEVQQCGRDLLDMGEIFPTASAEHVHVWLVSVTICILRSKFVRNDFFEVLSFYQRLMAEWFEQTAFVEPIYSRKARKLNGTNGFPKSMVDGFGLEQLDDCISERIVGKTSMATGLRWSILV